MLRDYTVDDIVAQVRSLLDEENVDTISDTEDILPALNRAQDYASSILARHYEEPLLAYTTLDLIAGQSEYDMPEDCFEERVERIEISANGSQYPLTRVSYRDISALESPNRGDVPQYYCIINRSIRILSTPSGAYDARMWYLRTPETLVMSQGRIEVVNTGSNYVLLETVGESLTTESDSLGSYVNIIDGQTGQIKGTHQVQLISDNRVTLKTTPIRSTVLNRDVAGSIVNTGIEPDDYICLIQGTCVPQFAKPMTNFMIQYSVAELTRKLGNGSQELEDRILTKFEKQVESTWSGREQHLRVSKRNSNWIRYRTARLNT
jgi:hypothetical protein